MPTTPSGCGISRFLAGMNCSAVATRRGAIHFFRCLTVCLISPSTNIDSANRVSMLLRWPKSAEIAASRRASLSATTARNRASRSRRCSSVAAGSDRDRSNRRWKASSRALWPGLFSDWSMAFSSTLLWGCALRFPAGFTGVYPAGKLGFCAGPGKSALSGRVWCRKARFRRFWQSQNPQKSPRSPFQSGPALVHTARTPRHSSGVAFSGSLGTD